MTIDLTTVSRWLAAVGLLGLALYDLTQGNLSGAGAALALAAADVGLKITTGPTPPKSGSPGGILGV